MSNQNNTDTDTQADRGFFVKIARNQEGQVRLGWKVVGFLGVVALGAAGQFAVASRRD